MTSGGMDSLSKDLQEDVVVDDGNEPRFWSKRRCNVEKLGFSDEALYDELLFTMKLLRKDARNKHAWSQRRWALEKLDNGYADEIGFCNLLLRSDNYNRLIWDQKWFVVQKCLAKGWTIIKSCEVTYLSSFIISSPECSYPWRFLRSLYKDNMEDLARNAHLRWALVCVFVQARDIVNTVTADKMLYENEKHARIFDSVNKRGCLFALDLVSDFLKQGEQLDKEAEEAIEDVFKDEKEYEGSTFALRVGCILREHRMEVMELCADLPGTLSHSAGKIKTSRSILFPIPLRNSGVKRKRTTFPPSHPGYELCGQGGFSTICVDLFPEDPSLVRSVRGRIQAKKEDRRRKLHKRQKVVTDFPQNNDGPYSKLPEPLRTVCLGFMKYTGFDSDKHTRFLLFCEGHSNPTAWQARRLAVFACDLVLEAEVEFLEVLSKGSSKNPLYWHHRRWVSERIGITAAEKELDFTEKILSEDANQYQAWSHRQWVRQVLFQEEWGKAEVAFCEKIIEKDSSNCYAWNQRYFVSKNYPGMRLKEVECAKEAINADPENEMPWMFLNCLDNLLVMKTSKPPGAT